MAITKTTTGSYKVEVFYPKDIRTVLGTDEARYRKTVSTKLEATTLEKMVKKQIRDAERKLNAGTISKNGEILFKDFYKKIWWPLYVAGASGRSRTIPSEETQDNTAKIFRLHLNPMFGEYSMNYLNLNPMFVMQELTIMSEKYANIRTVKSYVNQMFDTAEIAEYIDVNRMEKPLRQISSPKQKRLAERRKALGEYLTADQLIAWLDCAKVDCEVGKLKFEDYLLFLITLNLGDRKAESYGLQWKHVDLREGNVLIIQALKKSGKLGPTKTGKETSHVIPPFLIPMLKEWQEKQDQQLGNVGIKSGPDQFLFTYTNFRGGINQPLHADYLNYRMNSIYKRHADRLVRATPHKLRHTFATLARQGGAGIQEISEALTHGNIKTTRIYVNTPDIIALDVHDKFAARLAEAREKAIADENKFIQSR
ncbi:integrase [Lactobacillus sp. HMSC056D05]|nr:integrase [Lactobacillus sp. HMSC056D05]